MKKLLKLITVKPRYIATPFIAHTLCEQKLHLSRYLDLPLQIAVNKQWILWIHLILYTSLLNNVVCPSGLANMVIGHPMLSSKTSCLCIRKYQGRGPENCENKKFVTHSGVWNFLILTACNYFFFFIFFCLEQQITTTVNL